VREAGDLVMTIMGVERDCLAVDWEVSLKSGCAAEEVVAWITSVVVSTLVDLGFLVGLDLLNGRLLIYQKRRDRCAYAQF
jgi:hypothetical protein